MRAVMERADEVEALRDRVAMLESRLHEADKTRKMWEACMTSMVGAILLGPEMNDMCATPACGICFVGYSRVTPSGLRQLCELHPPDANAVPLQVQARVLGIAHSGFDEPRADRPRALRRLLFPVGPVRGASALPRPLALPLCFRVAAALVAELEHAGAGLARPPVTLCV